MNTPFLPGETPVKDGVANMQRSVEAVGGRLYLTNLRLIFESHAFNIQTGDTAIPLANITGSRKCWTKFLGLIPLVPNSIAVSTREGKEFRFVTFDRKGWLQAIEERRATAGTMPVPMPAAQVAAVRQESRPSEPAFSQRDFASGMPARPVAKGVSVLGIISLVLGGIGLPFSLIPCVNFLGLPFVGIGLLLGIIGYFVARSGQRSGTGLPIAGTIVSLVGLLVSLAWIGLMAFWVHDAENQRAQEEKAIREGPAITVSATGLFEQYETNTFDADSKYEGKVLEISGVVDRVGTENAIGKVTVELKTTEDGETIDCNFGLKHKADLAGLKPGQQVTIRGKCKGKVQGSVTLEDCVLNQ